MGGSGSLVGKGGKGGAGLAALFIAGFFATICASRSSRGSMPTESLLLLKRKSTGAVRLRIGTLRSDSRFFLAIVGGRISVKC